jgi:hypothetical protein
LTLIEKSKEFKIVSIGDAQRDPLSSGLRLHFQRPPFHRYPYVLVFAGHIPYRYAHTSKSATMLHVMMMMVRGLLLLAAACASAAAFQVVTTTTRRSVEAVVVRPRKIIVSMDLSSCARRSLSPSSSPPASSVLRMLSDAAASPEGDVNNSSDSTTTEPKGGATDSSSALEVVATVDTKLTWKTKIRNYLKGPDDGLTFKQRLAKMGLATALSYGWVSNMSYSVTVSAAWYIFSKQARTVFN